MAPPVDSIKDSTIAVIGDPACFWAVLPVDDEGHWSGTEGTSGALERSAKTYAVEAGSLLVHNLLTGTSPGDKSPYIDFNRDTDKVLESENLHHYYGALKNYENSRGDPHKKKIRISHFSGHQLGSKRTRTPAEPEKLGHEDFDTLVVCDLGLSKSFSWPHSPGGWTLLEINGARIEERASLKKFKDAHSENVVPNTAAILDVGALRRAGWEISADLSWERSTLDLLAEFEKHRRRATDPGDLGLQKFEFVVCTFRQAGALMIHNLDHEETGTLFFHPDVTEGSFDQKNRGSLFGLTSVICAAVADELHRVQRPEAGNIEAETNPKDAIRNGIARGLASGRRAFDAGFGPQERCDCNPDMPAHERDLPYPIQRIDDIENVSIGEIFVRLPSNYEARQGWTILQAKYSEQEIKKFAVPVAENGVDALKKKMVPYCQLGELLTVDREEIEDLRAVIKLIRRYLQSREGPSDASQIPPCSIVILGPPGTGKTFSVKEIAKSLQHDVGEHKPLTFNLSQFNSVDDLTDAFLRVQERRLCGAVPFVLWDEFDTEQNGRELGWLRQFLVPMEEGRFKRGDTWHPVGQSIFVFAGSSSETFSELQERADNTPNAKATDFLSRVDGYLDLKGVTTEKGEVTPDRVLARAIILNSLLRRTKVSGLATS